MNREMEDIPVNTAFRNSKNVGQFLELLFDEFNKQKIKYCVLHSYEKLPGFTESDVDMAVHKVDILRVEGIVSKVSDSLGFRVIQKLYYDIPRCYFYVITFYDGNKNPGFIQLDIMNDDYRIGRYFQNTELFIKKRKRYKNFYIPSGSAEACYLLTKKVIKRNLLNEHKERLKKHLNKNCNSLKNELVKLYGSKRIDDVYKLIYGADKKEQKTILDRLNRSLFLRHRVVRPHLLVLRYFWLIRRIANRIISKSGLIAVFISPDGGGKSTVVEIMRSRLYYAFRKSTKIHWRPYLLPPPRKLFKPHKWNEPENTNREPHRQMPKCRLSSTVRFIYYTTDFILGYIPKLLWPKIRTHLVTVERYYYDFLVDTKRYRLNIPYSLPRILIKVIPKPDLIFLLKGPPELINKRKQEIGVGEIQRQLDCYEELERKLKNTHIVRVDQELEKEMQQVIEIVIDTLYRRYKKVMSQ